MINAAKDCHPREIASRVWIDCTLTVESRFRTGVQRVVRMICREALAANQVPPEQSAAQLAQWQPVVSRNGTFYPAAMDGRDESTLRPAGFPPHWGDDVTANLPRFYRCVATAVCDARPNAKLRQWLLPLAGHKGIYKPIIKF